MTYDELQTNVEELEALIQTGNDYALAETQARELLAYIRTLSGVEMNGEIELHARTLLALSQSLLRRSMATEALPYAEEALALAEQIESKELQAKALGNIGIIYHYLANYSKALAYYIRSLAHHKHLGNISSVAQITGNIGGVYHILSDYAKALEYYNQSLVLYEELGNNNAIAKYMSNIGGVFWNLGNYPKAIEYHSRALGIHEELDDKLGIAVTTGSVALVYLKTYDYDKALEYTVRSLAIYEELGEKSGIAVATGNIGIVYQALNDYTKALEYSIIALNLFEELGMTGNVAGCMGVIGKLFGTLSYNNYSFDKAEMYLFQAIAMNVQLENKWSLKENYKDLAELYEKQGRWRESHFHFKKYHDLEKEVQTEEAKKQAELLDYERKQSEREKHIAVERAKHEATEQLLHNVLPPSIARRMVAGENLIAEKLPNVSVLFADIVGFTKLSQRISAEELVEGLDRIFSTFDTLAESYGLEKIKTIGDAYMVVAGAPEPRADHAEVMAAFAFEMVEAIQEFSSIGTGEQIQLRIGIHSGEVVAGVIGKKKFAYDLWGDAVNTASRMESHGEAGRIHVSEEFVRMLFPSQTLPDREGFSITDDSFTLSVGEGRGEDRMVAIPRGDLDIKGKGTMRTFFLERK